MIEHKFKFCTYIMNGDYNETLFWDGKKVPATPNFDDNYRKTAMELNYGENISAMCREHEFLHTFLMEKLGFGMSPTIRAVSLDQKEDSVAKNFQFLEESLVMNFQKFMNGGIMEVPDFWAPFTQHVDFPLLKNEASKILRR